MSGLIDPLKFLAGELGLLESVSERVPPLILAQILIRLRFCSLKSTQPDHTFEPLRVTEQCGYIGLPPLTARL